MFYFLDTEILSSTHNSNPVLKSKLSTYQNLDNTMPNAKWYYVTQIARSTDDLAELIRTQAEECWELVQVIPPNSIDNHYIAIFKIERSVHFAVYRT